MKDVIDGRNAEFMKCWGNGDIKGVSQLYTEDCKIMCAGCDTLVGRQGVKFTNRLLLHLSILAFSHSPYQ